MTPRTTAIRPFPETRAHLLDTARRQALSLAFGGHSGADLHHECGSHRGGGIRWHCLQAHHGSEREVALRVRDQGFPAFLPAGTFERRRQFVAAPLVPRYLFAAFDADVDAWRPLMHTRGVHRLLMLAERPIPIRRGQVERMIDAVRGHLAPVKAKATGIEVGTEVDIIDGPYTGWSSVVSWSDASRVRMSVNIFGREADVTMSASSVVARGD